MTHTLGSCRAGAVELLCVCELCTFIEEITKGLCWCLFTRDLSSLTQKPRFLASRLSCRAPPLPLTQYLSSGLWLGTWGGWLLLLPSLCSPVCSHLRWQWYLFRGPQALVVQCTDLIDLEDELVTHGELVENIIHNGISTLGFLSAVLWGCIREDRKLQICSELNMEKFFYLIAWGGCSRAVNIAPHPALQGPRLMVSLPPSTCSLWSQSGRAISATWRRERESGERAACSLGTRLELAQETSVHIGKSLVTWPA